MRFAIVAVLVLTVLSYSGVRQNGWVYEDAAMREAAEHLTPDYSNGLLTRNISRGSVYATARAFGPTPQAQHAVQLVGHLVNGVLVFAFASVLMPQLWALLAMAIFLLHPLSVDTAAYVASRPDLLMTTALLIALNMAVRPVTWWRGLVIGLAFFAGLASKQTAVVIAPLTLLMVWSRHPKDHDGFMWAREGFAWTFVGLLMAGATLALRLPHDLDALPYSTLGTAAYQSAAFWRQVLLVVVPAGFTMDHNIGIVPIGLAGFALAVNIAIGAWALAALWHQRVGYWPVLTLWPLLMVAPRFLLRQPEFFNEHQFYPAMPAMAMIVALVIKDIYELSTSEGRSRIHVSIHQPEPS